MIKKTLQKLGLPMLALAGMMMFVDPPKADAVHYYPYAYPNAHPNAYGPYYFQKSFRYGMYYPYYYYPNQDHAFSSGYWHEDGWDGYYGHHHGGGHHHHSHH